MKKFISTILVLAMLMTGFVMPVTATVATETNATNKLYGELISEDFSGNILPEGWSVSGDSDIVEWKDGTLAFKSTSDKNADVYYNLPETITSGIVTVSYKVKADYANDLYISLQDSDWESQGGTQTNLPSFYKVDGANKIGRQNIYTAAGTADAWITIAVRIDLNRCEATQTHFDANGKALYVDTFGWGRWLKKRNESDAQANLTKVKAIGIESVAGAGNGETYSYVDDVKLVHIPNRTDEVIFDYDFENVKSATDLYRYGVNFWEGANTMSYGISNDVVQGTTMKHSAGGGMYVFMLPSRNGKTGNSGITQIDFKLKPNGADAKPVIQLGGEINRAALNTDNRVLQGYNGKLYLGDKVDQLVHNIPFNANEWYDVSVIIDAPKKSYTVAVGQNGKEIIRRGALTLSLATYDPGYLIFRNYGGVYEIDDIKAVETSEYTVFNETFERYETVNTGTDAYTDMYKSGWSNHDCNGGKPGGEIVTGDDGNKVWYFNSGDLGWKFPSTVASSGKVRMEFSAKFEKDVLILAETVDSNSYYGTLVVQPCYNRIVTHTSGTGSAGKVLTSSYDPNAWYDFNIILDYDAQTYNVEMSTNGQSIIQLVNLPMDSVDSKTAKQVDLRKIGFRNWGKTAWLDDIKISVISELSDKDKLIVKDNFDGIIADNMSQRGWSSYYGGANQIAFATVDGRYGNSVVLQSASKDSGVKKMLYTSGNITGGIKISYDMKTNGAKMMSMVNTDAGKESPIGYFHDDGGVYHSLIGCGTGYYMGTIDTNKWNHIETYIDYNKKTCKYVITDEDGNHVINRTVPFFKGTNGTTDVDNTIASFGIRNWSDTLSAFVDNFEIAYWDANEPVLSTVSEVEIDNTKNNLVYSADINIAENEIVLLSFDDTEIFRYECGALTVCVPKTGAYPAGKYNIEAKINFEQKYEEVKVTLPDGSFFYTGCDDIIGEKTSASKMTVKSTSELCSVENQKVEYPAVTAREYTYPDAPEKTVFETKAYNLKSAFDVDAKTTRNLAWTAVPDFDDMAVVYAKADEFEDESKRVTVKGVKESPEEEQNQGVLYYKADITGLEPGTEYTYMIGDLTDNEWGRTYTFKTEGVNDTDFSFISIMDTQSAQYEMGDYDGFTATRAALDAALTTAPDSKFILLGGDNVQIGTNNSQWDALFHSVKGIVETVPLFSAVGNHDAWDVGWSSGNKPYGDLLYDLHFNNPNNGGRAAIGGKTADDLALTTSFNRNLVKNIDETIYSFDYGNVHVACLNTGATVSDDAILVEAQREWLDNDLKNSDATWKVVMMHVPVYCSDSPFMNRVEVMDIIEDNGVDLVITAHEHLVSRTYQMKDGQAVSMSMNQDYLQKGAGTIYSSFGATTKGKSINGTVVPEIMLAVDPGVEPTYAVIDVSEGELNVTVKSVNGVEVDKYTLLNDGSYSAIKNVTVGERPFILGDLEAGAEAKVWFNHRNSEDLNKDYCVFAAYYNADGVLESVQKIADGAAENAIEEISYSYAAPQKQNIGKVKFFVWYADNTLMPAGRDYTVDK